uniref:CBS domain-containing protein n=1 Tax=Lotharella oceanica TaxID=641309 RepID=A0A7S2X9S2_9EUKA|mmetsp:Transcript_19545/g.36803  ORF Transcript_19545/g.36803 Transcript_19545/m.36803 type:complete len:316 (+) Transcript_19545:65-1012(+)
MHACTYAHTHTRTHAQAHRRINAHTHTQTHKHTRTQTHAHAHFRFALPVFLTALTARWSANFFNTGIFDMTVRARKLPFLKWKPPGWYAKITAVDVMSKDLVTFRELHPAGDLLRILRGNTHNAFPVVAEHTPPSSRALHADKHPVGKVLAGLVLRKHVCAALSRQTRHKVLVDPRLARDSKFTVMSPAFTTSELTWEDIEGTYPRYPSADDLSLDAKESRMLVDLRALYNPTPFVVRPIATVHHVYQIFRQLGLRHCVVARRSGEPVGIITRKDLTEEHCRDRLASARERGRFSIVNMSASYAYAPYGPTSPFF